MKLDHITNGDMVRVDLKTGTAVEGRFMHTKPARDTTSPEGPYIWFADGIRVFDLVGRDEEILRITVLRHAPSVEAARLVKDRINFWDRQLGGLYALRHVDMDSLRTARGELSVWKYVKKVNEIHKDFGNGYCGECSKGSISGEVRYPCPTAQLSEGLI